MGLAKRREPGPTLSLDMFAFENALFFLGVRDLLSFCVVSRPWQRLGEHAEPWRLLVTTLDPRGALGVARARELGARLSWKGLAVTLAGQHCQLCGGFTPCFFVLMCCRVCEDCFHSDERASLCTVAFAYSNFLLNAGQARELPTICVEDAPETGLPVGQTSTVTLTTVAAARAAALERFGSAEGFAAALAARRAEAIAAGAPDAATTLGPEALNVVAERQRQPKRRGPQPFLTRPEGPKYGHHVIVSRTFFEESGRRIVVEGEGARCGRGGGGGGGGGSCRGGGRDVDVISTAGRNIDGSVVLRQAIREAGDGGVVIVRGTLTVRQRLVVKTPVMIIGAPGGGVIALATNHDTTAELVGEQRAVPAGSLHLKGPGCQLLADLTVTREIARDVEERQPPGGTEDDRADFANGFRGSAIVFAAAHGVVQNCTIGPCDLGAAILQKAGNLLVTRCKFVGKGGPSRYCPYVDDGGMWVDGSYSLEGSEGTTAVLLDNDMGETVLRGAGKFFPQKDGELASRNSFAPVKGRDWRRQD